MNFEIAFYLSTSAALIFGARLLATGAYLRAYQRMLSVSLAARHEVIKREGETSVGLKTVPLDHASFVMDANRPKLILTNEAHNAIFYAISYGRDLNDVKTAIKCKRHASRVLRSASKCPELVKALANK